MPKVGTRHFPYTPEGIAEANAYSEQVGLPVIAEDNIPEGGDSLMGVSDTLESTLPFMSPEEVGHEDIPSYDAGGRVKIIEGYGDGGKVKK
jgi:hypothetical protein